MMTSLLLQVPMAGALEVGVLEAEALLEAEAPAAEAPAAEAPGPEGAALHRAVGPTVAAQARQEKRRCHRRG